MFWYDRSGKSAGSILKRSDGMANVRLSPDGKAVAFISGGPRRPDIWLYDMNRHVTQRFTFNGGRDAVWSPEGSQIAFDRQPDGLFKKGSGGAGTEEVLWNEQALLNATDWSADGRFVLYSQRDAKTGTDLWLLPLAGDRKPVPLLQTPFAESRGRFSPAPGGGAPHWVSYESDESGRNEIYVMTMPGQAPGKWQISSGGGVNAHWRRDGRELYYLGPDNQTIMAVDIDPGPVFHAGTPHALFTIDGLRGAGAWDVNADGSKFLGSVRAAEPSTSLIYVVLNWQAALKKP